MSAMPRQGSASYTIAIVGVTAVVVGAIVLTFFAYPIINGFTGAAFWSLDSIAGQRLTRYAEAMWVFTGGFIMIGIISFIWIRTRQ